MGYSDDKIRRPCQEGLANGWTGFKLKVGLDLDDDRRRAASIREEIGPDCLLMMDANQRWDVGEAIINLQSLSTFDPLWIEEPTSPDDVLGHTAVARAIAPVGLATREHVHNRVMFKQLLQAEAISFCQIDCARLGGVNEVLPVLLMAAKFGVPVCPHGAVSGCVSASSTCRSSTTCVAAGRSRVGCSSSSIMFTSTSWIRWSSTEVPIGSR